MRTHLVFGGLLLFFSLGGESHVNPYGNCVESATDFCWRMGVAWPKSLSVSAEAFLRTQVFVGTGRTLEPDNERHKRIFLAFRDQMVYELLSQWPRRQPLSVAVAYKSAVRQMQHSILYSGHWCSTGRIGPKYIRNLRDLGVVYLLLVFGERTDPMDIPIPSTWARCICGWLTPRGNN